MGSMLGFSDAGTDVGGDGSVVDAMVKLLVADPGQCGRDGLGLLGVGGCGVGVVRGWPSGSS